MGRKKRIKALFHGKGIEKNTRDRDSRNHSNSYLAVLLPFFSQLSKWVPRICRFGISFLSILLKEVRGESTYV